MLGKSAAVHISFAAMAESSVDGAGVELDGDEALKPCVSELPVEELTEVEFELDEPPPQPTATNSANAHTVSARRAAALVANINRVMPTPSSIAEQSFTRSDPSGR